MQKNNPHFAVDQTAEMVTVSTAGADSGFEVGYTDDRMPDFRHGVSVRLWTDIGTADITMVHITMDTRMAQWLAAEILSRTVTRPDND